MAWSHTTFGRPCQFSSESEQHSQRSALLMKKRFLITIKSESESESLKHLTACCLALWEINTVQSPIRRAPQQANSQSRKHSWNKLNSNPSSCSAVSHSVFTGTVAHTAVLGLHKWSHYSPLRKMHLNRKRLWRRSIFSNTTEPKQDGCKREGVGERELEMCTVHLRWKDVNEDHTQLP